MLPALFSVSYAGYWGQHRLDLPGFFQKAAHLGYPAVEIAGKRPHLSILDFRGDDSLANLRGQASAAGVQIVTVAGYTDFTSGRTSTEVPFVEMQLAYVRELARAAQLLGARIVRVFSGYSEDLREYPADWNKCVQALREGATICAECGVVLGLQNHHDLGISVAGYEALLEDVAHPNLKAMFDPWSVALTGGDMYEAARRMAPHMVQTTLADYVRVERFAYRPSLINYERLQPDLVRAVPLGEGFVDCEEFFEGLKDGGFDGIVAYEMCSPVRGGGSEANLDQTARHSLKTIEKLIAPN